VTRNHRNTYVGGSLLTQEMQEEFSPLLHDFWHASFQHGC
jgi:hypothetical protein